MLLTVPGPVKPDGPLLRIAARPSAHHGCGGALCKHRLADVGLAGLAVLLAGAPGAQVDRAVVGAGDALQARNTLHVIAANGHARCTTHGPCHQRIECNASQVIDTSTRNGWLS
jgi:hypothetical protein